MRRHEPLRERDDRRLGPQAVAGELGEQLRSALPLVTDRVQIWAHGPGAADLPRIDGEDKRDFSVQRPTGPVDEFVLRFQKPL